jgi:hypothetical protein
MSLLVIILILILLNGGAGVFHPGYLGSAYYGFSWPTIIVVILVLYLLGVR